jgi:hypothetical protein
MRLVGDNGYKLTKDFILIDKNCCTKLPKCCTSAQPTRTEEHQIFD